MEPELRKRESHIGGLGSDAQIAGGSDAHSRADGGSIDGCDHRHWQLQQRQEARIEGTHHGRVVAGLVVGAVQQKVQIAAGAERFALAS